MSFRRTALAQEMARQLPRPTFLDTSLRSGLFLSGQRRVGKTTSLATDLIPALQDLGAIVIYVDLWEPAASQPGGSGPRRHPQVLECAANPRFGDAPLKLILKLVSTFQTGAASFKCGFKLADVGKEGGISLSQAFTELIDQSKTDLVLIVDEVRHAFGSAV